MTIPFIVGNWKMNTSLEEATTLARTLAILADRMGSAVDIGICPPYPWIVPAMEAAEDSPLRIGAQDCAAHDNGAFTGDVSATMLASCCAFTLIGHSERRSIHRETDNVIRQKVGQALNARLDVILCVGETADERDAGKADQVVRRQLDAALDGISDTDVRRLTIAYEPVWAIGTGVAATEDDASRMATLIHEDLDTRFGSTAQHVRILYGGSANDRNAPAFLAASHVDGLLVGSASLSGPAFTSMVESAAVTP